MANLNWAFLRPLKASKLAKIGLSERLIQSLKQFELLYLKNNSKWRLAKEEMELFNRAKIMEFLAGFRDQLYLNFEDLN